MKHLNRMTARELETELSRLVHLRTATCRITPIFEPQGLGFVNDIDGNELARCTYEDVRDYIVTFDPAMGANPLMVCQNLYIVHGRPAWSAQFLIATLNQCGRFTSIRYEFQGEEGKDEWGCRAVATELATGEKLAGPLITIGLAKKEGWYGKNGSKWQSMPELMLRYRAASWFVRAYAPEIAMGLKTAEEVQDTYDLEPAEDGTYRVQRRIRPYDLRHAFVTEAIAAGVDIGTVGKLVGHANLTMILKHYQHVLSSQKRAAVEAIPEPQYVAKNMWQSESTPENIKQ